MEDLRFDAKRGMRIREARGTRTQIEFAELIGVTPRTVQRWEAGHPPLNEVPLRLIAAKTRKRFGWLAYGAAVAATVALVLIEWVSL